MAVTKKKKTNEDVTTNEVVVVEQVDHKPMIRDADILNMDYSFDDKIEVATKVAASLKNVIQSQDLAVKIGPSEYVTAEGWEVLGTMLGCTPYVESVEEIPVEKGDFIRIITGVALYQGRLYNPVNLSCDNGYVTFDNCCGLWLSLISS